MLRADSGTAYRGAYGKGITSGVEVQRRSSGNFDSPHQQETSSASPAQSSGILLESKSQPDFAEPPGAGQLDSWKRLMFVALYGLNFSSHQ